jgi:hypothetical protein
MIAQQFYQEETRPIDMRAQFDEPCVAYEYKSLTHYFPVNRVDLFEKALSLFDGSYTMGVKSATEYGDLNCLQVNFEFAKNIQQVQFAFSPANQLSIEPDILDLSYHIQRKEHRLNFISKVEVHSNSLIHLAKTADLSSSGLKINMEGTIPLERGQDIELRFVGLEERTGKLPFHVVPFRVMGLEPNEKRTTIRLMRLESEDGEEFSKFIDEFVRVNASRYKYELSDHIVAVKTDILRYAYCQHLIEIPLLFSKNRKLQFLLKSRNNEALAQFLSAKMAFDLETLISRKFSDRVDNQAIVLGILALDPEQKEAAQWLLPADIEKSGKKKLLFAVSANVINWPRPAILKEFMSAFEQSAGEDAAAMRDVIASLHWVVYLRPMNNVLYRKEEKSLQEALSLKLKLPELYQLNIEQSPLIALDTDYSKAEDFYKYESVVTAHLDGKKIKGKMLLYNTSEIIVKASNNLDLSLRQEIRVTFDEVIEKYSPAQNMERQEYRVQAYDARSGQITLQVDYRKRKHGARDFFAQLIGKNSDRLVKSNSPAYNEDLKDFLINLIGMNQFTPPFVVSRQVRKGYFVQALGASEIDSHLTRFLSGQKEIFWYALCQPIVIEHLAKSAESAHGKIIKTGFVDVIINKNGQKFQYCICDPKKPLLKQLEPFVDDPGCRFIRYSISPKIDAPIDEISEHYQFVWRHARNQANLLAKFYKDMLSTLELWDLTLLLKPIVASLKDKD